MQEILYDVNNSNNKVVQNGLSFDEQSNFMLQILVDGYLARKKQPSLAKLLEKEGLPNTPGVIYGLHIQFIQIYLEEEFHILGLELSEEVAKHGETFAVGKLSKFENTILINKLSNLIGTLDVVRKRQMDKLNK